MNHVVMVIEDDDDLRSVICENIEERFGVTAHAAATGRVALDMINAGLRPDLIVTDFMMPEMDGLEFGHELRGAGLDTPLIFVTGVERQDLPAAAFQLGSFDFVQKPMDERFFECIENALALVRMGWASPDDLKPGGRKAV
jgi:CheY-like chemotaxis protein